MKQIEFTEEQIQKLKNFLSDALDWTDEIERSDTRLIDNSCCTSQEYYTENYDRIATEDNARKEQIEEIRQMFGG